MQPEGCDAGPPTRGGDPYAVIGPAPSPLTHAVDEDGAVAHPRRRRTAEEATDGQSPRTSTVGEPAVNMTFA